MKKFFVVLIILVAVVGLGIFLSRQDSKPVVSNDLSAAPSDNALLNNMQQAGLSVLSAEGTVLHIHQHIDIIINGQNYAIPAHIGIGSYFISPIHTHDTTGVIHVESPIQKDFHLGQFFQEWGVTFNNNCIASFCADANNKLAVGVNGKQIDNPADYILKAHDEIEIWYGPKSQNPAFIGSYSFAPGL